MPGTVWRMSRDVNVSRNVLRSISKTGHWNKKRWIVSGTEQVEQRHHEPDQQWNETFEVNNDQIEVCLIVTDLMREGNWATGYCRTTGAIAL